MRGPALNLLVYQQHCALCLSDLSMSLPLTNGAVHSCNSKYIVLRCTGCMLASKCIRVHACTRSLRRLCKVSSPDRSLDFTLPSSFKKVKWPVQLELNRQNMPLSSETSNLDSEACCHDLAPGSAFFKPMALQVEACQSFMSLVVSGLLIHMYTLPSCGAAG